MTQETIWLVAICSVPDGIKGMMKGAIKALGAQQACVKVNMSGHWCINLSMTLILAVYLGMHVPGQWIAKIILEIYIMIAYFLLIYMQDWEKIARDTRSNIGINETLLHPQLEGNVNDKIIIANMV